MTQLYRASKGQITDEMQKVAENEGIDVQKLARRVAKGYVVIPTNNNRNTKPCGIGKGLSTKINANLGSSPEMENVNLEVNKAQMAVKYGADAIMDLSTGINYKKVRKAIIKNTNVPLGTVPIYQAGINASKKRGAVINMEEEDMFKAIEEQAQEGVDFMTIHSGITQDTVEKVKESERIMGVVSRGGAFLTA